MNFTNIYLYEGFSLPKTWRLDPDTTTAMVLSFYQQPFNTAHTIPWYTNWILFFFPLLRQMNWVKWMYNIIFTLKRKLLLLLLQEKGGGMKALKLVFNGIQSTVILVRWPEAGKRCWSSQSNRICGSISRILWDKKVKDRRFGSVCQCQSSKQAGLLRRVSDG